MVGERLRAAFAALEDLRMALDAELAARAGPHAEAERLSAAYAEQQAQLEELRTERNRLQAMLDDRAAEVAMLGGHAEDTARARQGGRGRGPEP